MKEVKPSQNFVSMAETLRCVDGDVTDTASNTDTELWLVQVPLGFQVSALNKLDSSVLGVLGGTQTLKVKTEQENKVFYSVTAFRDSEKISVGENDVNEAVECHSHRSVWCQKMSTVVTGTSGQVSLGGDVRNMLIVTEAAKHSAWPADNTLPAPKRPVPMPEGLKMRYTPFGAGTPCPSVSGKSKKKKKHALKAEEECVGELDGVSHDSRKSRKKRKREAIPDPDQEPSPKKKKSKHRHSQSIQSQSADSQSPEKTPERRKSKSQHRKSEGAAKNSPGDGQVFVIDRVGHPNFTAEDEPENHHNTTDRNTKHKKSKKEKKHRKTM